MRRATVLVATTAAAMVGLVASAVPGTAAPASAPAAGAAATSLGAVLVGGNEVPTTGDPDAWGLADVTVEPGEVCWHVTANAVTRPFAAGHIHAGPAGVAGPVVIPLDPIRAGCADVPRRLTRFVATHPNQFYVNLHNAESPAGAMRGQLLP